MHMHEMTIPFTGNHIIYSKINTYLLIQVEEISRIIVQIGELLTKVENLRMFISIDDIATVEGMKHSF